MKNSKLFILLVSVLLVAASCGKDKKDKKDFNRIDECQEFFVIEAGHGLDFYTRDTELSLKIAEDTNLPVFINKKKSTYKDAIKAFEEGKAKSSWIRVVVYPGWKFYKDGSAWKLKK